ncbi:MAG: biotin synthase BioB [Planctomycetota bacterium]|nr:biotin synthase BioB [Planctomycetota bacterium]MDA1139579.1 biotin synthase BioB [Planctomycetota bacterium]
MTPDFYTDLTTDSLNGKLLDGATSLRILEDQDIDLFPLLNAAYTVRKEYWGKEVQIHILNNAQNGHCPEDCSYCSQAKTADTDIESYRMKPDAEILDEARLAYESGAHRYCMVFAGRGPSDKRTAHLAGLIRKIKSRYPLEICVSAGLLDEDKARVLAEAGLNRFNHNLNTSERNYPNICTTHTYSDRLDTLKAARNSGLQVCSGLIVGMGETRAELLEVANTLRELNAESIPVNFFLPLPGTELEPTQDLTPDYCLRVLCLFRFLNPKAEIRAAAGREVYFRSLEPMCLYPANSVFLQGYLNARGGERKQTLQMILDAGFTIKSEVPLEELMEREKSQANQLVDSKGRLNVLKTESELRPARNLVDA